MAVINPARAQTIHTARCERRVILYSQHSTAEYPRRKMVIRVPSVPCPQHDGGLCNVPDPAVLISDGEFSLIRAKTVPQLYPDIESRIPQEVQLRESIHYNEIVKSVAESLTPAAAIAGTDDVDEYGPRPSGHILDAVASAVGSSSGILVNCSCGHLFTV